MPCGQKWKNKSINRVPYGVGGLRGGHWQGRGSVDLRPYVVYQPGCPSISIPGVFYNYSRGQCGRYYQPGTIRNAVPTCGPCEPSCEEVEACCHPCMQGFPCECGGSCREGVAGRPPKRAAKVPVRGMGRARGQSQRFKQYAARFAQARGVGGSALGGSVGCNPGLGPNWALGGCAPNSRPYGLVFDYQRNHNRWPPNKRTGPFPVSQRPYYVGYAVPTYLEPFAGCATRQAPYWVVDPRCPEGGTGIGRRGLTKTPKRLGSTRALTLR